MDLDTFDIGDSFFSGVRKRSRINVDLEDNVRRKYCESCFLMYT